MARLGAIFAGGQARRFGSDKALIVVEGQPLIARVSAALSPQVDVVAVVGRAWGGLASISDRPRHGLGPLGALAGALVHALEHGFTEVLTSGCDLPDLPHDLVTRLSPAPAILAGQPLVGLWPAHLADSLLDYLGTATDLSMRGWIAAAQARRVSPASPLANINTPADLADYLRLSAGPRSSP